MLSSIMENMVAVKFCYRLVVSSIICATFLKNKLRELLDGVDEEESTKDEDFGKIQPSLGKESVPLLMSENKCQPISLRWGSMVHIGTSCDMSSIILVRIEILSQ